MSNIMIQIVKRATLLPLLFAASCTTPSATSIPRPESAMSITFPFPEGASVCEMEEISSRSIREYLPRCTIFATTALDAWGNPAFVNQPFILSPRSKPMLLPDYSASAAFVSGLKRPVGSIDDARERLLLLADIQSWQLCKQLPEEMRGREEADDPGWIAKWIYDEQKRPAGWQFKCVFLTDPFIRHYQAFRIIVSEQGNIVVEKVESLGLAPGHSGYI